METPKIGLVLTGGGARAAYQAGVIKGIAEILEESGLPSPFKIITGLSAGAINATFLAGNVENFTESAHRLTHEWGKLYTERIYRTDLVSVLKHGTRLVLEVTSGALSGRKKLRGLLDSRPLSEFITNGVSFEKIKQNIDNKLIDALAITTLNYYDGSSHIFYYSGGRVKPWQRIRRYSQETPIHPAHVQASTAIPMLFPPVRIGPHYYGDGSLRNHHPMSPAIHLGAEKLLVIAVRREEQEEEQQTLPTPGRVFSVLLNSLFLDALDVDYHHLLNINRTLACSENKDQGPFRPIDTFMMRPSEDIGKIAFEEMGSMPQLIQYLVSGLGTSSETAGITSYLLFEASFTRRLIDLGYQDAFAQKGELLRFCSPS